MDIREKITELVVHHPSVMSEDYNLIYELSVSILSLIRQEIADAIPKEQEAYLEGADDWVPDYAEGYNRALKDIRTALKEKGLLGTV